MDDDERRRLAALVLMHQHALEAEVVEREERAALEEDEAAMEEDTEAMDREHEEEVKEMQEQAHQRLRAERMMADSAIFQKRRRLRTVVVNHMNQHMHTANLSSFIAYFEHARLQASVDEDRGKARKFDDCTTTTWTSRHFEQSATHITISA